MKAARRVKVEPLAAVVDVAIADPALADAVASSIGERLRATVDGLLPAERRRVVRLRTRRRLSELAELGAEGLERAIVIVRVTEANARHLVSMLEVARPHAAGVQLVWDGATPPRARVERHVFAALEGARGTAGAPVVLAPEAEPALALQLLVAARARS